MVCVRGARLDSFYQQQPPDVLDVRCFRHPGSQSVFGGFGMVVWRALVLRILELEIRNSWGCRLMYYIYNDRNYYSVYAGWLGCLRARVSSNGRQRCFPYEGRRSLCCISLFAEAGCSESVTFGGFGKGILRPLRTNLNQLTPIYYAKFLY
jgi:hypothetical protein